MLSIRLKRTSALTAEGRDVARRRGAVGLRNTECMFDDIGTAVPEESFVELLIQLVPESRNLVDEHFADYDELLIHLLMSDLLRFATAAFAHDDIDLTQRLLQFLDHALREGDERVNNAVAVSFVENIGTHEGETPEFVASWPRGLLDERDRQRRGDSTTTS